MKKFPFLIMSIIALLTIAATAYAEVTAIIGGSKYKADNFQQLASAALKDGKNLASVIKGAAEAGAPLKDILLAARSSGAEDTEFVAVALQNRISCELCINALLETGASKASIARTAIGGGCEESVVAKIMGQSTLGLGYTPAAPAGSAPPVMGGGLPGQQIVVVSQ